MLAMTGVTLPLSLSLHRQTWGGVEKHHADGDKDSHDDAEGVPVFFVFFVEKHNRYIMLTDIRYILYDK